MATPQQPMDAERFGGYIERRLSLFDEQIQLIDREGMELRLMVGEREVTVDLATYYEAYAHKPEQIDAVFQTLTRILLGDLPVETESDYPTLVDRICLMLKPIALLAEVRERNLPMLVYREFLADLIIVYTIDDNRRIAYVNEDHLDRWGVTAQELHAQALDNLRKRTAAVSFTTVGERDQRLYISNSGDGYDASRLLLTELLTQWARTLPGALVIGIPNRDFLIAFSSANPDTLRAVAHQIQVDSVQHDHGLTDQLFTLERGAVREFEWE